jgi:hypothetical protein
MVYKEKTIKCYGILIFIIKKAQQIAKKKRKREKRKEREEVKIRNKN